MKLTVVMIALGFVWPVFAAEQGTTNVRNFVIAEMETYSSNRVQHGQIRAFNSDEERLAIDCVRVAISEVEQETRSRLVRTALGCAERSWKAARTTWYTNDTVLLSLLEFVGKQDYPNILESLNEIVSPVWLNRHAQVVRPWLEAKVARYRNDPGEFIHLYAMLDSVTLEDLRKNFGDQLSDTRWIWALARKGDTNAQERLSKLATGSKLESPPFRYTYELGRAIGHAGVEKLLRIAARELRAEDYVEGLYNFGIAPCKRNVRMLRREIWMLAIYTAMNNEAEPSSRRVEEYYPCYQTHDKENAIMDVLEKWCTKKYGIQYPTTPRKELPYIEPGSDPYGENLKLRSKYMMEVKLGPTNLFLLRNIGQIDGGEKLQLSELKDWVLAHRNSAPVWEIIMPENIPIADAHKVVEQFDAASCTNLSIIVNDADRKMKREIIIYLESEGQFRFRTPVPAPYAEILDKLGVRRFEGNTDSYLATGTVDGLEAKLGTVLKHLPDLAKHKHVCLVARIYNGLMARTIFDAIESLERLGITTVSFTDGSLPI